MNGLERRYRRLLSWYPRDHRERHGEEMLVVLMSGARDRSRPTPRESLDLVWGAVRLHLRRVVAADGGVDPRDVLAIVALLGPVALLTGATNGVHEIAWWVKAGALAQMPWLEQFPDAPVWVLWGVVAVLVLRGLRRTAAFFAWSAVAVCVLLAAFVPFQRWWIGMDSGWLLTGLLTAVALTWSRPHRSRSRTRSTSRCCGPSTRRTGSGQSVCSSSASGTARHWSTASRRSWRRRSSFSWFRRRNSTTISSRKSSTSSWS